jgi:hypothetical protein
VRPGLRWQHQIASLKKSEFPEVRLRIGMGALTVGVLIVLPAIKMIEAALS